MSLTLNARGSPVQYATPGPSTCVQQICSQDSCSDNGLEFQCLSIVKMGYDINFLGLTMECDGDTGSYPYLACTCTWDPVNCNSGGSENGEGSQSVVGATGYAQSTTVVGGPTAAPTTPAPVPCSGGGCNSNGAGMRMTDSLGWAARMIIVVVLLSAVVL